MASMTSRVAARRAAQDRGRQDRRCGNEDARDHAFSRNALEHALNGERVWPVSFDSASHLERILSAASSQRDLHGGAVLNSGAA